MQLRGARLSGNHSDQEAVTHRSTRAPDAACRVAVADPALSARVISRAPLLYAGGADAALDRPAHVRAASSLAMVGGRLAIIQDDANFIAVLDPSDGRIESITLPAAAGGERQFDDRRGNKRFKLDLEASVAVVDEGTCALLRGHRGAG